AQADALFELFRPRASEKGLTFSVAYGPGAQGWYTGDAVRIRQVLGNLISNAIKFTSHGEIQVAIDVHQPGPAAPAHAFDVRHTGSGFDEAFARKLFQRFSQADGSITRRFGGTGLGLSICHALVEMMGGQIQAASAPGRGSQFSVEVPLPRHAGIEPATEAAV